MKAALVTGDAGFVGRHLVTELLRRGYHVTGVDTRSISDFDFDLRKGSYISITQDCRSWFTRYADMQWDLVFHCAAVIGGRLGIEENPLAVADDIDIDIAFFRWLRQSDVKHAVYYSSSAAYPVELQRHSESGAQRRLRESDIDLPHDISMPDMTYGWAKLTGEYVAQFVQRERPEMGIHILRPFSGYGNDQALDYPFPSIIKRAKTRMQPLEIWSDAVRDFIHIDDVVGATFAVIDADYREPLNLCTGIATSFSHLAKMAATYEQMRYVDSLYDPEVTIVSGRPAGVHYRVGDPTKLHRLYTPQVTIAEGVRKAIWTG